MGKPAEASPNDGRRVIALFSMVPIDYQEVAFEQLVEGFEGDHDYRQIL